MKRPILCAMTVSLMGLLLSLPCVAQNLKVGMTSKTLFYLPFYAGLKRGFYPSSRISD